jgi:hypothetical protein
MEISIIEIIKNEAEYDHLWLHIKTIDLEEFEFLICCVAWYASVNNFERVWAIGRTRVQSALENYCIKLT